MRVAWPKYVNLHVCSWISSSFDMSTFRLQFLLVTTPQINTGISKFLSFFFRSSLSVQVSELLSIIVWTRVWYNNTFVDLLMLLAFHILWRFPPRYPNCSHCTNSPFPSTIFTSCVSLPMHCTSVFVLLTLKPNLLQLCGVCLLGVAGHWYFQLPNRHHQQNEDWRYWRQKC